MDLVPWVIIGLLIVAIVCGGLIYWIQKWYR